MTGAFLALQPFQSEHESAEVCTRCISVPHNGTIYADGSERILSRMIYVLSRGMKRAPMAIMAKP